MEDKVFKLFEALNVTDKTKERFAESFNLMLTAKTKSDGLNLRFELGGMLSSLEAQYVISTEDLKAVNQAIGDVWKAKSKAFYFTERAIEKAQKV